MKEHKYVKWILACIVIVFLLAGSWYAYKYFADKNTYEQDLSIINSAYLNKRQGALKESIPVKKINNIPDTYYKMNNRHIIEIKKEYERLVPLAKNQLTAMTSIALMFDGKSYYSDAVTADKIAIVNKQANQINNEKLRSRLLNKLDNIDLWFVQTQTAVKQLEKLKNNKTINFSDYVLAQSNYQLIKNKNLKHKYKPLMRKFAEMYKQNVRNNKLKNSTDLKSAVEAAKIEAESSKAYTPAKVNINLITKNEQNLSKALKDNNIDSSTAMLVQDKTLYLLKYKEKGYYKIEDQYSLSSSLTSGKYSANETINISGNLTNYDIKQGALVIGNDSSHELYKVLNVDEDYSYSDNEAEIQQDDKLFLFNNDSNYLVLTNNKINNINNGNQIELNANGINKLATFIKKDTELLVL